MSGRYRNIYCGVGYTRLGAQHPEDPLGVFQTDSGDTVYLTGDMITKYYRYVTKIVFPTIYDAELMLFSCHSVRVVALS